MRIYTILFLACTTLTANFAFAQEHQSVRIVTPQPETTIHDNNGNLNVRVEVSPQLRREGGNRVTLLVDGQAVASTTRPDYMLTGIDRGTHTLTAQVTNAQGDVLATSGQVTFHMWRASRLFPDRRLAPDRK
jgi:hypothetical protein